MNIKTLMILILLITQSTASNIRLMTETFPPFQYEEDGLLIGISVDTVRAIEKRIGSKSIIKVYPWTRGVKVLNKKKNTALFSMLRTPDRENKYKWVGPLTSMKLVFFKKKGSPIILKTLEDAKKVGKVGVTKSVANYEMLKAKGFSNLDVITSGQDEKNIRKLVKGRIDLWPTLMMSGLYNARKMGLAGEVVPIENVVAFEGDLYIAFNIHTDDAVIDLWQNALDDMKKNHELEAISKRYR